MPDGILWTPCNPYAACLLILFRTNLGLDNVFIERFWRSLKQEKIYMIILNTVKEAKNAITDYINFYNKKRMHQSLEYLTPEQVHFRKIIV